MFSGCMFRFKGNLHISDFKKSWGESIVICMLGIQSIRPRFFEVTNFGAPHPHLGAFFLSVKPCGTEKTSAEVFSPLKTFKGE